MALYSVILAGGSGTRLWPLSRANRPKQFLDPLQQGQSLLQQTYHRAQSLSKHPPILLANLEHRFLLQQQLQSKGFQPPDALLEPEGRNTAISVVLACLHCLERDADAQLVLMPCDHYVEDEATFHHAINTLIRDSVNQIGLLLVQAHAPVEHYGYVSLNDDNSVSHFIEKPSRDVAENLLLDGRAFWNAGVLVARADVILQQAQEHAPRTLEVAKACYNSKRKVFDFQVVGDQIQQAPNISFDHAVLDKTKCLKAALYTKGWDDLGSWPALLARRKRLGLDGIFAETSAAIISFSQQELLVVNERDVCVIAEADDLTQLAKAGDYLHKIGRQDLLDSLNVYRPWGQFKVLSEGDGFLVKQLRLYPAGKISLQSHEFRNEHWVVVSGQALVQLDQKQIQLNVGEGISIKQGLKHRLSNVGNDDLVVVEVQVGRHLDEEDIVRYDDAYFRPIQE